MKEPKHMACLRIHIYCCRIDEMVECELPSFQVFNKVNYIRNIFLIHRRGEDGLPDSVERNNYNLGIWRIYEEGFDQFNQNKLLPTEHDCRGKE
ncbi:hypothetical protein [Fonticella tunisiensis]|uniref:Uncharacterized protein n=1 Tax=Fonticella tunisiensis TaxID=1096341 RepID=A0A4R7KSF5_9CLOT|nr:hypothetical protein [Fonticella tunisiensis]TDT61898.1 hypothetical protein EDD71_10577 [Fonticella tunisiensis]